VNVILDTNVVLSGIFFTGPPYQILQHWAEGSLTLIISQEILDEYIDAADELGRSFPAIDPAPILSMVALHSELYEPKSSPSPYAPISMTTNFLPVLSQVTAH